MSLEKRRPRGVLVSLRGGLNTGFSENISDGAASDLMSQIGESALDSRVPPRSMLKRHAQDESDDGLHDARPTGAAPVAVVPLESHPFPVPSHERIWRDQGLKLV